MKKKKLGIVASSVAAIAVCTSMVVGSTYALFTSESKVDIAVTAGKVNVTATVENVKTYSMNVEQEEGKFENGGTAGFNDNAVLTLNNVTPGDSVKFDIQIKNESTVKVKYLVSYTVKGELADVLNTEITEVSTDVWYDWAVPTTEAEKVKKASVSVSLPENVGNEYQEKSANVSFVVEAVQGNAKTQNNVINSYGFAESKEVDAFCPLCDGGKTHEGPHTPNLTVENGQATFNKEGAWFYNDKLDWENKYYQISYDVDLTALEDGKYIAFDQGKCEPWVSVHLGFVNEGGKYIAYNGLGAKGNSVYGEVAQQVKVTVTFFKVGDKLNMTLNLSGLGDVLTNKADAVAEKVYWDVYTVSEGAKAAIDNFEFIEREGRLTDSENFNQALSQAKKGDVIALSEDIALTQKLGNVDGIIIDGKGHKVSTTSDPIAEYGKDVTFRNCVFESKANDWLICTAEANFVDCTFNKNSAPNAPTAALYIRPSRELRITGCTFNNIWLMIAYSEPFALLNDQIDCAYDDAKVILTNNTFNIDTDCFKEDGSINYSAVSVTTRSRTAVEALTYLEKHFVMTGNTFVNQTGKNASAISIGNHFGEGYEQFNDSYKVPVFEGNNYVGGNIYGSLGYREGDENKIVVTLYN